MGENTGIEWTQVHAKRFWSSIRKSDQCWEWTAGRFSGGMRYGQFRVGKKKVKAHRFSWLMHFGEIPEGMRVLHKCDNPICVRPDHFFLGTDRDNIADCVAKGRSRNGSAEHRELWTGERNAAAKITANVAAEIRETRRRSTLTLKQIGARYGLCQSQVRNIVTGRSWQEVA